MKAKIKISDMTSAVEGYPKLMHWHNDENFVVLFTARGVGTVVRSNAGDYEVGYWSDGWSCCEEEWSTFYGNVKVKLSN